MFGSNVLEVAISIIFVYILLSLLCSTINEQIIVRILSLRAQILQEGITNMLDNPALVIELYNHPLIKALSQDTLYAKSAKVQAARAVQAGASLTPAKPAKVRRPSYIPADIFALALKDVLMQQRAAASGAMGAVSPAPLNLLNLETTLKKLNINIEKDLTGVEVWFNSAMARVSGWYKRRVQLFIFLLGIVIAVGLNIDTLSIITTVSHDATVRATLVSAAQGYTTQHTPDLNALESNINQVQPMIGWYGFPNDFQSWLLKIVGLLTTTLAVGLGAPFWFDVLNKFVSFRSSGPQPPASAGVSPLTAPAQAEVARSDAPPNTPVPQDVSANGTDVPVR
ncbi:MAG: hypothetical protein NVS2B12_41000 [Ktedonobacteraceae bacterium]